MAIELVDLHRGDESRYSWVPPFDFETDYENARWWDEAAYLIDDPWFVQVLENGAEVARVEFDDPGGINPEYVDVPTMGQERLEIQFFEVATFTRGHGVGTRAVLALQDAHPDRHLFAYSEDAHRFWASLGWERFDHPDGEQFHRPLFIQRR